MLTLKLLLPSGREVFGDILKSEASEVIDISLINRSSSSLVQEMKKSITMSPPKKYSNLLVISL